MKKIRKNLIFDCISIVLNQFGSLSTCSYANQKSDPIHVRSGQILRVETQFQFLWFLN